MSISIDHLPVERMSRKAFEALGEYSCSLPTGQKIGKVWKRNARAYTTENHLPPLWMICEYVDHPDPSKIGIDYRRIEILE